MLLSSMILLAYYHRVEQKSIEIRNKLLFNLKSAEQLALSNPGHFEHFKTEIIDLYGSTRDSVSIQKLPWGFFDHFDVRAFQSRFASQSHFELGYLPDTLMQSAFYLYDDRRPLSVAGDTRLSGVLYLPQSGIQSAFIDRQGYQNDSLYYGEKRLSGDSLPALRDDLFDRWDILSKYTTRLVNDAGSHRHSFLNDTVLRISGGRLEIADTLEGKIFIDAAQVDFLPTSRTRDIIVKAEVIRFHEGYEGSGQFLAEDSLLVTGANLVYPSVLFLNNERSVGTMAIEKGARVQGLVGLTGDPNLYSQRIMRIEDGVKVQGVVYCNGYLEVYGKIAGHVTTRKTLVRTQNAVYENYIFNGEIEGNADAQSLRLPGIWRSFGQKEILQWLQ